MQKIKILYIIDKLRPAGAQKHLSELISGLNKEVFESKLVTLEELGVGRIYGLTGIKGLLRLVRVIKEFKPDIFQSYLFSENILGVIAAKIAGVKIIITGRRDTGMLREGKFWHILAYKLTNRWADKIICVSEAVKKVALAKERVDPEKLVVIYNGVDVGRFSCQSSAISCQLKEKLGIKEDEFVVGMIANFSWIKGHRDFIAAAQIILKELPNTKFLLIGEGSLRKEIESAVRRTPYAVREKILFLDSRQDIPEFLSVMDISVNASYSEGMSNTVLESMAAGVPVVATAVDGNLETVADGVTGIFVQPKDTKALAEAIISILNDRELAEKLGKNGRKVAEEKFTAEKMIKNFENLYQRLLRPKIAFILSQFPETHETFILREFRALEEKGIDFKILSLKPCRDKVVHPEAKELIKQTEYGLAHSSWAIAHSLIHPIRTMQTLGYVLGSYWKNPKELIKTLYVWLECLYFTRLIKREKISHIHSHWATMPTTAAAILSKLTGRPFSFTAHAWDIFVNSNGLVNKIKDAKFVVTCTDYNRRYLQSLVTRDTKVTGVASKIYRNYHGINLDEFGVLQTSSVSEPQLKILAIGRLVETKGFEYLIKACAILRDKGVDFECRIVGSGPLERKLKLSVVSYQLSDKVRLLGIQTQEEIKKLYGEAMILVQPSVMAGNGDRDGIPNVIIEAMTMGLPVVATSISGIPEVVIDGKAGILIPEKDALALANAMEQLWRSQQLREMLALNGRALIEEKFNVEKNTEELIDIFQENGVLN